MREFITILFAFLVINASGHAQTCGSTNIALTKGVSASSYLNEYSAPGNIVDGNNTSNWKSGSNTSQWITIDLGQSYSICNIELTWATSFTFPTAYTVEVSPDGIAGNGTIVLNTTTGDGSADQISLTTPVVGQYIRIHATTRAAAWADKYELFEVIVNSGSGNALPTISVTSPSNNATYVAGNNVTITANASDDGTITKVEFYQGTTKLGEDQSAPYSFTWSNVAAGSYSIAAKAYDNDNASTTSGAVSINVTNPAAGSSWTVTGNASIDPSIQFLGTTDAQPLILKTNGAERVKITTDGKMLINTSTSPDPEADLAVKGNIWAKKLKITQANWADFVFDSTYQLMTLAEVEQFIQQHKHLPEVPTAKQVSENGLNVGDMQALLLRKIEELTLYIIEQEKKIRNLELKLK